MKPLFFIILWNFKIGGIQKHGVLLANYLLTQGFEVTILFKSKDGELIDLLDSSVKLLELSLPSTNSPFRLWQLYKGLSEIIPKGAIVLANGPNNFRQLGRLNAIFRSWRILYILQNDLEFKKSWSSFLKKIEMRVICNSSKSRIVALSSKQKNKHEKDLGLKRVTVIPNFVNVDHHYVSEQKRVIPKGVSIGRYANQKGYDILIEAMGRLKGDLEVDVYGSGSDGKLRLQKMAKDLNLSSINFHDAILNVFEVISRYDYFILSSRYEPFGIVVAEALSCGLPVLTTDCEGPIDMIDDSNGIVVERNNAMSLAQGIQQIVTKIQAGHYKSSLIKEKAAVYSIDRVAVSYISLFQKVGGGND